MPFTLRPHVQQPDPRTKRLRVVKTIPYVRLCGGNGPPVFIQAGHVYSENGKLVEQYPDWFEEELAKVTPYTLNQVQFSTGRPAPEKKRRRKRQVETESPSTSSE